jgi:hypothetical protein
LIGPQLTENFSGAKKNWPWRGLSCAFFLGLGNGAVSQWLWIIRTKRFEGTIKTTA